MIEDPHLLHKWRARLTGFTGHCGTDPARAKDPAAFKWRLWVGLQFFRHEKLKTWWYSLDFSSIQRTTWDVKSLSLDIPCGNLTVRELESHHWKRAKSTSQPRRSRPARIFQATPGARQRLRGLWRSQKDAEEVGNTWKYKVNSVYLCIIMFIFKYFLYLFGGCHKNKKTGCWNHDVCWTVIELVYVVVCHDLFCDPMNPMCNLGKMQANSYIVHKPS